MEKTIITKILGGVEDLLLDASGENIVLQKRNNKMVRVTKINADTLPYEGKYSFTGFISIKSKIKSIEKLVEPLPADNKDTKAKVLAFNESLTKLEEQSATNTEDIAILKKAPTFKGEVQTGSIVYFIGSIAPLGYLELNGSTISRSAYSKLFALLGTKYGAGNGTTTFQLPDFRGEFIRTWDNGRGIDRNRQLGTYQADEFKEHTHKWQYNSFEGAVGAGFNNTKNYMGEKNSKNTLDLITTTGGAETRPRNIAVMAVIKY